MTTDERHAAAEQLRRKGEANLGFFPTPLDAGVVCALADVPMDSLELRYLNTDDGIWLKPPLYPKKIPANEHV